MRKTHLYKDVEYLCCGLVRTPSRKETTDKSQVTCEVCKGKIKNDENTIEENLVGESGGSQQIRAD